MTKLKNTKINNLAVAVPVILTTMLAVNYIVALKNKPEGKTLHFNGTQLLFTGISVLTGLIIFQKISEEIFETKEENKTPKS